jgi:surfeit locus 1 family protein
MASIQTKFGSFTFRFIPTLVALAGISLFMALGHWQLNRAEQKRALQSQFESRTQHAAITFDDIKANPALASWTFYPIRLVGQFDNRHTLLLDNRFYNHQAGYHVITPFVLNSDNNRLNDKHHNSDIPVNQNKTVILIDRGFISMGINRQTLPTVPVAEGTLQITGIITRPDPKSFALSHIIDNPGQWPARLELIDFPIITQLIQRPVLPMVIVLSAKQAGGEGLIQDWQLTTMKPEVHLGYAFQWFAMAGALGVIFAIMSFKRKS